MSMNKKGLLKIIILSVVFGLSAGIVGQLIATAYLLPTETIIFTEEGKIRRTTKQQIEERDKINEAYKMVAPTVFEIYPQKTSTPNLLNQIYLPTERVAFGVVLTSDGWLASFGKTIADPKKNFVVITADQKIFFPKKIFFDEATGVVFLKIDAQNLPVPKLGNYKDSALGEKVILPLGNQTIKISQIQSLTYENIKMPQDFIKSSEKFTKSIFLNNLSMTSEAGIPVVNLEGEVIGLTKDSASEVVPINFWQKSLFSILKKDKIERPFLGIHYLNLTKATGLSKTMNQTKIAGVLVFSSNDLQVPGVAKNSPAAQAGIEDNDIILKIDNEELTAKNDFTEIIQNYSPGDKIELTILRAGEEKTLKVTLGEKL